MYYIIESFYNSSDNRKIYSQTKVQVRINGKSTTPNSDIRQGHSLSPILLNILMNEIIKKIYVLVRDVEWTTKNSKLSMLMTMTP